MVLVCLSHSFSDEMSFSSGIFTFVKLIQWAALTSFMWCSGYLFTTNEPVKKYGIKKYYFGRLERLMLPYVFVSLVMFLPKLFIAENSGKTLEMNVLKLLCYPRESVLPHLWFLPTLMIISLLAPLFQKIIENKWGAAVLAAVTFVLMFLPDVTGYFAVDDVKRYVFWFVFGMITVKYRGNAREQSRGARMLAIGAAITYVLILLSGMGENVKFAFMGICTLEIMIFCAETVSKHYHKSYFKKYTMVIYILSVPAQNAAEILLKKVDLNGFVGAIVLFAVGIAVPMVIGAAVSFIFGKRGKYFPGKLIGLAENGTEAKWKT